MLLKTLAFLWNATNTVPGLVIGLLNPTCPKWHDETFEFHMNRGLVSAICKRLGISAFTLGDCILYSVPPQRNLRVHERRHVAQYRLFGPFFLPVYFLLLLFFGYYRHPLERDARRHEKRVCGDLYSSRLAPTGSNND